MPTANSRQPTAPRKPRPPETAIAAPVADLLVRRGYAVRHETPVVLGGESISLDLLARGLEDETGADWFVAVEVKRTLTFHLVEQCLRWRGWANRVYAAVAEPSHRSNTFEACRLKLRGHGVGLLVVKNAGSPPPHPIVEMLHEADARPEADTRLLAEAHGRPAGQLDPPAGSASGPTVHRNTPARSKWAPATEYVRANPGCSGAEIRRARVLAHDATPAAMVKAVIRHDWTGVRVQERDVPATFWPADES